jgi:hypothetical protein
MKTSRTRPVALILAAMFSAVGCSAVTQTAHVGLLSNRESLVTLVVTEDQSVVARGCNDIPRVQGCRHAGFSTLADGTVLRTVKIVRYTDAPPTPETFASEARQLCEVIAALQSASVSCHEMQASLAIPR